MTIKDGSLIFKCADCNKNYKKWFDGDLVKSFEYTHRFCGQNFNEFCLILEKVVYLYMNRRIVARDPMKRHYQIKKTLQPDNGRHHWCWLQRSKKFLKSFCKTNFWWIWWSIHLDWHVITSKEWIKIYELDAAYFLSALGL